MATIHGNDGVITIATNALAQITDFTFTRTVSYPPKTVMGATADSYQTGGPENIKGSITCRYDKTDTNGQEALQPNTELAAIMYPDGNSSGKPTHSVTILIEEITQTQNMGDVVSRSFTWIGQGAMTDGVVGA